MLECRRSSSTSTVGTGMAAPLTGPIRRISGHSGWQPAAVEADSWDNTPEAVEVWAANLQQFWRFASLP